MVSGTLLKNKKQIFSIQLIANDFNGLLKFYQRKKADYNENYLSENMMLDRLIVMDDVSSHADRSEEFDNFLTGS